jgi:hypothetical protein
MGHRQRRRHDFRPVPAFLYGSIWIDKARWFDEPWVHVVVAFLLMGALYVGVSWLIHILLGGPSA